MALENNTDESRRLAGINAQLDGIKVVVVDLNKSIKSDLSSLRFGMQAQQKALSDYFSRQRNTQLYDKVNGEAKALSKISGKETSYSEKVAIKESKELTELFGQLSNNLTRAIQDTALDQSVVNSLVSSMQANELTTNKMQQILADIKDGKMSTDELARQMGVKIDEATKNGMRPFFENLIQSIKDDKIAESEISGTDPEEERAVREAILRAIQEEQKRKKAEDIAKKRAGDRVTTTSEMLKGHAAVAGDGGGLIQDFAKNMLGPMGSAAVGAALRSFVPILLPLAGIALGLNSIFTSLKYSLLLADDLYKLYKGTQENNVRNAETAKKQDQRTDAKIESVISNERTWELKGAIGEAKEQEIARAEIPKFLLDKGFSQKEILDVAKKDACMGINQASDMVYQKIKNFNNTKWYSPSSWYSDNPNDYVKKTLELMVSAGCDAVMAAPDVATVIEIANAVIDKILIEGAVMANALGGAQTNVPDLIGYGEASRGNLSAFIPDLFGSDAAADSIKAGSEAGNKKYQALDLSGVGGKYKTGEISDRFSPHLPVGASPEDRKNPTMWDNQKYVRNPEIFLDIDKEHKWWEGRNATDNVHRAGDFNKIFNPRSIWGESAMLDTIDEKRALYTDLNAVVGSLAIDSPFEEDYTKEIVDELKRHASMVMHYDHEQRSVAAHNLEMYKQFLNEARASSVAIQKAADAMAAASAQGAHAVNIIREETDPSQIESPTQAAY